MFLFPNFDVTHKNCENARDLENMMQRIVAVGVHGGHKGSGRDTVD